MSKYNSRRTPCPYGHTHDSAKEASRCAELNLLERAGEIINLESRRKFYLHVNGKKVGFYEADFTYNEFQKPAQVGVELELELVVEDVKGVKTAVYNLKKRMMKAEYGIDIKEI